MKGKPMYVMVAMLISITSLKSIEPTWIYIFRQRS